MIHTRFSPKEFVCECARATDKGFQEVTLWSYQHENNFQLASANQNVGCNHSTIFGSFSAAAQNELQEFVYNKSL